MNTKNFLVAGTIGGIVNFLLGWVFYGMLFSAFFPEGEEMNLVFTFLGCLTSGLFIAFIFAKWARITAPLTGLKAGAIIGLFTSLSMNFFMFSNKAVDYKYIALDTVISMVISSLVGAAVAVILAKMK